MITNSKDVFRIEFGIASLAFTFAERIEDASKAVGRDGTTVEDFKSRLDDEIEITLRKVYQSTYQFTGYKERLISKGADKPPRQLSVATVRDRLALRALCNVLMVVFKDRLLPAPHAFISEIRNLLNGIAPGYSFVQVDITNFYPSVRHDFLMGRIRSRTRYPPLVNLVKNAIETPTGKSNIYKNSSGIPQGLSISNILSSIYMGKFDDTMKDRGFYLRYVDDILIVCPELQALKTFRFVSRRLQKLGLTAHSLEKNSKSKIVGIDDGVEYLGYRISRNLISVRKSSYQRMINNILNVFTQYKYKKRKTRLRLRLNLKVTGCYIDGKKFGWMFFFSQTEDLNQLARLDYFVEQQLKKYGLNSDFDAKRFLKTYHEIRYNADTTKYIPHFDNYTFNQKAQFVADLEGISLEEVLQRDVSTVERIFRRNVRKEIAELERDLSEALS